MRKSTIRAGFSEHLFDTGEITMNYVVGPNNGPALVLIPPQGASWENYEKVMPLLSNAFQVFVVDIRGHGKSDWTTGNYTFNTIGADMSAFLQKIVKRPAILSGNSSGGLIAIWLGANRPEDVLAIVAEDPPLFSADWPRIKSEFVYYVLKSTGEIISVITDSRCVGALAEAFQKIERPLENGRIRKLPRWAANLLAWVVRKQQAGGPVYTVVSKLLPSKYRQFAEVLTSFDPDFSQSWVDGRIYQGLEHEAALKKLQCPVLLLHANWFRSVEHGLIGAMDDEDAARARALIPNCDFRRIDKAHVVHSADPRAFVELVTDFVDTQIKPA